MSSEGVRLVREPSRPYYTSAPAQAQPRDHREQHHRVLLSQTHRKDHHPSHPSHGQHPQHPQHGQLSQQPQHSQHSQHHSKPAGLPKAEPPNFNIFSNYHPAGYPAALPFLHQDKKELKPQPTLVLTKDHQSHQTHQSHQSHQPHQSHHSSHHHSQLNQHNQHNPHHQQQQQQQQQHPQLLSDLKNSVIVKNDKSPGLHSAPSPKLRDYLPANKSPYEYRSPSQSPHLAVVAASSPRGGQAGQGGHGHPHRQSPLPPHRQSPHLSPSPGPLGGPLYPKATVASYPYPTASYSTPPTPPTPSTPPKHKVYSPAPAPYAKLQQPTPRTRSDPPPPPLATKLPPTTPSPYQHLSQHNLPPPTQHPALAPGLPPPPAAHSRLYSTIKPAPSPPGQTFQTQPLDLGLSKEEGHSPKRKSELEEPPPDDFPHSKKIKVEVEEVAALALTVPTPPTNLVVKEETTRPETPQTPLTPGTPQTPVKVEDKAGSPQPPAKPPTPAPTPSATPYPVHKLKKAWLQRHSGEDVTHDSDVKGTGSCLTLPMPLPTPTARAASPATPANPKLHSIGSMAVNSIKRPKGARKPKELNGHVTTKGPPPDQDDSSSSDPDRKTTPGKRLPPKVKRKRGGRKPAADESKRKKGSVASSTDSEKESGSDKESDSGASNTTATATTPTPTPTPTNNGTVSKKTDKATGGVKKRGRRPKVSANTTANATNPPKNGNDEESRPNNKKPKDDDWQAALKEAKPSIGHLKKTGESFLQDGPCFEVAPKLAKCRECRWTPNQRNRNMPNIFCRFYAFRRLRYTKNGQLAIAGFSDPHRDASQEDLKLWLPLADVAPVGLDVEMASFLLTQVGEQFCDLLAQEREAIKVHMSDDKTIAWKRVVQGVREMCDVCETTLFNFHWACGKCGFVVCIDCYKGRKKGTVKQWESSNKERDDLAWLLCTNRQPHEQEKLMLTQIIAGDSLTTLGKKVHEAKAVWNIPMDCSCNSPAKTNGLNRDLAEPGDDYSCLRELLIRPSGKGSRPTSPDLEEKEGKDLKDGKEDKSEAELKHFIRRFMSRQLGRTHAGRPAAATDGAVGADTPHAWLCGGRLLQLLDPQHPKNYRMFQDQWRAGCPVLVSDVLRPLPGPARDQWKPESFIADFGTTKADLVNCATGTTLPNQLLFRFWEGFSLLSRRLKDDKGQPMVLKLKDWPPGEDFAEMMPSRFQELMKVLPLAEYTQRNGRFNLASRLPDCFVRPDLGPKMYTAYGCPPAQVPETVGTTNLHLDISDAVNVMMYVGVPSDVDADLHVKEVLKAVDEAGCDVVTRRRVREKDQLPGALWHIYQAKDADKIRDLLNKVSIERGGRMEPHHDPIHDQSWYLDAELRDRLYAEYKVEGFAIVQCIGDAVFIPAGAPHQVRNLHNCIKVAEDFVSPENVSYCFTLTQEFRYLSDKHTNHEDKLQIKNIMYHTVKDSLAVLEAAEPPAAVPGPEPAAAATPTAPAGATLPRLADQPSSPGSSPGHSPPPPDAAPPHNGLPAPAPATTPKASS